MAAARPAWRDAKARSPHRLGCRRRRIVRGLVVNAVAVMRHKARAQVAPHHLQETETHQEGTERDAQIDHPAWPFELRRDLVRIELVDIDGAQRADDAGE